MSRINQHAVTPPSLNNLAPPPSVFPPAPPGSIGVPTSINVSNRASPTFSTGAPLDGLALSSELRRILNMSTLDPDVSVLAESATLRPVSSAANLARSMHGLPTVEEEERNRAAARQVGSVVVFCRTEFVLTREKLSVLFLYLQYMLLERYHSHNLLASRPQEVQDPESSTREQPSGRQQMSMSVTEGALRMDATRRGPSSPGGRAENHRLGSSTMF